VNLALMIIGQLIVYLLLMLFDEYFGQMLAIIVGAISMAVWAISHIVEWIEPSRVNRKYYQYMLSGWVGPALALILFIFLRGEVGWMS
jgi:hypothetical protein